MKKHLYNINNNVTLNRQVYLKARNNYKISFESNNIRKVQNNNDDNSQKHIRNKTEPLMNKMDKKNIINIPKYFEESLQILHTIQHYVTMSAENNNKSLIKEKTNVKTNKKVKHSKKQFYIKLTSNQKFDMAKNIIDDSNKRKLTYSNLFNMINISIDEIKNFFLNENQNFIQKENKVNFNIQIPVKEILPFQDDISSITVYNFSESEINEKIIIKETPKKEQMGILKTSKNDDESSTIINDDSYGENKNVAPIKNKNIINKGNNTNLSTVVSTNNTNANLITNEKLKNKKIYTEGNNNLNELEKINELSKKNSQEEILNDKRECNIF